jgi:hypothetical protein
VIRGFFRSAGGSAEGDAAPAFAGPGPVAQPRRVGPPPPAFAPNVAQPSCAGDAFAVDPARLDLASGGGRPFVPRQPSKGALN